MPAPHARYRYHAAPCPACGEAVRTDDVDGPVWTCPANLGAASPWYESPDERITEELMEANGVYSHCGEDFGWPCHEDLPLHDTCYDSGTY